MNIALVGFMGTGKTAVGQLLAEKLGMKYIDSDDVIEEDFGMKISKIFEQLGEPFFRELEKKAIDSYQKMWRDLEDEKEKLIIRYILNDEIRHHRLLKQLHAQVVTKITFTAEDYWDWAWKDTEWGGGS